MKIAIACSKSWFQLDEVVSINNEVLLINDQSLLTRKGLDIFKPDLIFFPHWNWLVPADIFENFKCILFHTAPLPYGRGGSPIQNLILEKFDNTPVCAVKMTCDLDAGPIYSKKNIDLSGSLAEIFERINTVVNQLIVELIRDLPEPIPQEGDVHKFNRRMNDDNKIPKGLNIEDFFDRMRMLDDNSYPNSFITYGDMKIEFSSISRKGNIIESWCRIKKC